MPRATHPGPAALRNRNRVTNKTRLKVIRDTIEADSIVIDEDEEKARVVSTAGVDAEDANEHHLQAVLTAAASRHQASRSTRSGDSKETAPAAYIPTPDSTGVVQNYDDLYVQARWKDPNTYVKSSDTIEEATSFALANGFIYYMDERDKEWLDKNNEQARGEGMSSQGATASSTRSARSAKAKGKEPDIIQAIPITEDEFELVMAIFEKITHEKTEFLHHGLEQGAPFPPFSDYQDTFAFPLQADLFAVYSVPEWVPSPLQMLRYARIIYSYWRERRLERGGHRIIPAVNLDESDTKNESYICFRRREIKAVRKTRASQASYSDRMIRLQGELNTALEIVRHVRQRERAKRETFAHNHQVWEKRHAFADLKRAHPSLVSKEDEELFLDKEKPPKKPRIDSGRPSLKLRHPREAGDTASPVTPPIPQIRPKERLAAISANVDQELQRFKERDRNWEDSIDYPYQTLPAPPACRFFRQFPPRSSPASSSSLEDDPPTYRYAVRLRHGRGGRRLDRHRADFRLRAADFGDDVESRDRAQRLEERFRYDDDDGPVGLEDQDRKIIDEMQPKHLTVTMSIYQSEDYQKLVGENRPTTITPQPTNLMRPNNPSAQRQPSGTSPMAIAGSSSSVQAGSNAINGTPVAMQAQVKKLPQPNNLAHLRISSSRVAPGSTPNGLTHPTSPHATPPSSASVNGFAEMQGSPAKHVEQDVKLSGHGSPHASQDTSIVTASPSPTPSKPLVSNGGVNVPNLTNGYHIPTVNGFAGVPKAGGYMHPGARHNALGAQMQSMSAMLPDSVNIALRQQGSYVMPTGYPMQIANARSMQWSMPGQHSPSNVMDNTALTSSAGSPGRVPSTNSIRAPQIARNAAMPTTTQVLSANQGMQSPHIARLAPPHSPSPHMLSPSLAAAQVNVHSSPTRAPQPAIPTPSPSMQSRQLVGGSGAAGY